VACESELDEAWQRLFGPAITTRDEHDIVVYHGNVIRWFTERVLQNKTINWLEASIAIAALRFFGCALTARPS
jgi:hypothetical protein